MQKEMQKEFYSKYLKKNITLEVHESGSPTHDSLMDYILNELDPDLHFWYDIAPDADSTKEHPIRKCEIRDINRRVVACGEATLANIDDDKPACRACNRAFDRAATLYLWLVPAQKPNSDGDKPKSEPKAEKKAEKKPEKKAEPKKSVPAPEAKNDEPAVTEPEKVEESKPVQESEPNAEPVQEAPSENNEAPVEAEKTDMENVNNAIPADYPASEAENVNLDDPAASWNQPYEFGKYRGTGKTFKQVADEAPDYADWLVKNSKNRTIAEVFEAYLSAKNKEA